MRAVTAPSLLPSSSLPSSPLPFPQKMVAFSYDILQLTLFTKARSGVSQGEASDEVTLWSLHPQKKYIHLAKVGR